MAIAMTDSEVLRQYRWVAETTAIRYRYKAEVEDLKQEALIALLGAAKAWRPDGGLSFKNYARQYINGTLRRYLSRAEHTIRAASLDAESEIGLCLHDKIRSNDPGPEELVGNAEQGQVLRETLRKLPVVERELLESWASHGPREKKGSPKRSSAALRRRILLAKFSRLLRLRVELGAPRRVAV